MLKLTHMLKCCDKCERALRLRPNLRTSPNLNLRLRPSLRSGLRVILTISKNSCELFIRSELILRGFQTLMVLEPRYFCIILVLRTVKGTIRVLDDKV